MTNGQSPKNDRRSRCRFRGSMAMKATIMNRIRLLFCFCLFAPASFAAETGMRLTIPRTAHPPTLDGKLAPGEWDDATAVTGIINQFDGVAHPRQATFWLKYDDKFMYVAQRSTLLPGEKNTPASRAASLM